MKNSRKPRDDGRFALATLQNPTLEVRGLRQFIATAEQIVAQEATAPDALPSDDTPPPKEVQLSPEKAAADDPLPERGRPSQNCSPPKPLCRKTPRPSLNHRSCLPTHQILNRAESAKLSSAEPRGHRARKRRKTAPVSRPRGANSPTSSAICQHPDRDRIDEYFLHCIRRIAGDFAIPTVRYIYRHAHATGLMQRRRLAMRAGLQPHQRPGANGWIRTRASSSPPKSGSPSLPMPKGTF